ncbi:hypothetical protein RGV59_26320 [Pseudomonas sp. FG1]|uniref:hypothetical protein n=1 Tax=Pseudomonas sp. FG1 TaxID=3048624 RepID=UPI002AB5412C|nr:hypothetical protein [Pseudomonas sp. FG1]MDY7554269.1 hypothetical protein [Pseudomonas sp. FG1]MEB0052343.1 hypothetical protein [Pseudomonas sp. FG1]
MPTENKLLSLATGHDLNQWRLVPVEPTETMVINGFESEPDECFSNEEVWEQYQEMSGCQQAAFRAKLCWAAMLAAAPVSPQAELDRAVAERGANPEPDPVLCKFYDVSDWPGLVRELVGHMAQLQDSAKRNVKPWEDTFPPTLLPAYIERVNSENSAAQPKGEQLACMPVERCYDVRAKMIIAFNEARKNGGDLDDALDAAYKSALRYSPTPMSAEQPAPVAVVPDGYCIMPRQLTAENGAKSLLLGEFKLLITKECPECCELEEPTEGCSICDGEGEYGQKHTIPWDQIKFIYSKAVSGLAVKAESAKPR